MKITLFAVRHGNKVYEFREPVEVEVIKRGRMKNICCNFKGLYISDYAESYAKVFKQLGEVVNYYYNLAAQDEKGKEFWLNLITVREIA